MDNAFILMGEKTEYRLTNASKGVDSMMGLVEIFYYLFLFFSIKQKDHKLPVKIRKV